MYMFSELTILNWEIGVQIYNYNLKNELVCFVCFSVKTLLLGQGESATLLCALSQTPATILISRKVENHRQD